MNTATQKIHPWGTSALSSYLLEWEQMRCDRAVADIFGYHCLQMGLPMLRALRNNRIPHQWLAVADKELYLENKDETSFCQAHLSCAPEALPFAEASLDLLVMPHTLDLCHDPHAVLREAARVLMPEGRLLLFGLNPLSLWGMQQRLERLPALGFDAAKGVPYWRVRDWLNVLALDVQAVDFGCYVPAVQTAPWLQRWRWMDRLGAKAWPVLGAVYCIEAVKKVHGMRLLDPQWSTAKSKGKVVSAAACQQQTSQREKM